MTPEMNWGNKDFDNVKHFCLFNVSNNDELKKNFC